MAHRPGFLATVLALVVLVPASASAQASDSTATVEALVGSWISASEGDTEHLVIHVQQGEGGTLSGTADHPERGLFGLPISHIRIDDGYVTLVFENVGYRFEGAMQTSGEGIRGAWIGRESSDSADLTLVPLTDSVAAELPKPPEARRPEARPADVESPEAIVEAAYRAISGPAGEEPDWDRLRSLCLPEARLVQTGRTGSVPIYRVRTVEEFIDPGPRDQAFYEDELHSVTQRYGDIAHVFSSYASRRSPEGEPFSRGINSFQLWFDGDRWWIVDIFWHAGAPIPERYRG